MKDFKNWHEKKKMVDRIVARPYFHEREIWYCALGINVGFEQDGRGVDFLRPVVVFQKFNNEIFWGIPLTHTKKITRFYYSFSFISNVVSVAVLSQIRLIDARRLNNKMGEMGKGDFEQLTKKFKELLP